jgi:phage N-6-adenine-methyltransferase
MGKQRVNSDECYTPKPLFTLIEKRWGSFTIDVAATCENRLVERWCGRCAHAQTGGIPHSPAAFDGLAHDWSNETVWCNPPYSDVTPWILKAPTARRAVLLLNADPSTEWWSLIDRGAHFVCFLKGRVSFDGPGALSRNRKTGELERNSATRPSVVVVWDRSWAGSPMLLPQWDWKKEIL